MVFVPRSGALHKGHVFDRAAVRGADDLAAGGAVQGASRSIIMLLTTLLLWLKR
jgi:hypothetical protein